MVKIEVFSSDSCPHCPAAITLAEEAKAEFGDKIDLVIANIGNDEYRAKAIEYGIMAVPTIVFDGNVEFLGAPSKEDFIKTLKSYLG